jgi:hypothetical protein
MTDKTQPQLSFADIDTEALDDLVRRVQDIDNCYRAVAEKIGQLYMRVDELKLGEVTAQLDKPMRNASDNEQSFVALLDDMRMQRAQRH